MRNMLYILISMLIVGAVYANSDTEFTVVSVAKWQNTGVEVSPGKRFSISYKGGFWTSNPATGYVNARGNARYRAKAGSALPGAPEGMLIGKVGNRVFAVGMHAEVPAELSGHLELVINDDLRERYGAGFNDNRGSITVKIAAE